jgi:hypothetical protein
MLTRTATLTVFLTPHINTLPIHASLARNSRSSFPIPCLSTSTFILVLSLPLALVPYYLLPLDASLPSSPSGIFGYLPGDDGWVNLARVFMCAVVLGTSNMWILRGRDTVISALGVEREGRQKAARWVGLGLWVIVVFVACLGGWIAEKVELLGVMAALAIGWFLPCKSRTGSHLTLALFFIITFHVRSPLAIVLATKPTEPAPSRRTLGHGRSDSLTDPSTDALLARKEQQLQKRRTGRRLWQDLIVYVGIMPVGSLSIVWTFGKLIGVW